MALRDITFEIRPSEKIGIVGRTGSGKTTLFQLLFRLVEVSSGEVLIDGLNINSVGLTTLRWDSNLSNSRFKVDSTFLDPAWQSYRKIPLSSVERYEKTWIPWGSSAIGTSGFHWKDVTWAMWLLGGRWAFTPTCWNEADCSLPARNSYSALHALCYLMLG